jgi:hypothetical protein
MRLQTCVGSVCGGDTSLMCRGRDVHDWVRRLDASPSTRRWSVEVYVSQGPHQGATVVFGYIEGSFLVSRTGDACEHYAPNIYRCILTYTVYQTIIKKIIKTSPSPSPCR